MTLREFHNGLRILTSLDRYELVEAGVLDADDDAAWTTFRDNPHRWLIQAGEADAEKLWALLLKRGAVRPVAA